MLSCDNLLWLSWLSRHVGTRERASPVREIDAKRQSYIIIGAGPLYKYT